MHTTTGLRSLDFETGWNAVFTVGSALACFHQCTLYSLHLKVSVNHFFHILFSSSPPVQMRKKWNVHNSLGALSNYRFSFAHSLHSCSLLFTLSYRDLLTFFFNLLNICLQIYPLLFEFELRTVMRAPVRTEIVYKAT